MKTKLLVALIACLAISACSKVEEGKDKGAEGTQQGTGATATPAPQAPAGQNTPPQQGAHPGPQSMNDDVDHHHDHTTTLAADTAQTAPASSSDAPVDTSKTQQMGQQHDTSSHSVHSINTSTTESTHDAHEHPED